MGCADLRDLHTYMFQKVGSVYDLPELPYICWPDGICVICMICACFAGWDPYYLDIVHNFSVSVKKDLDDLDRDLSYCVGVEMFDLKHENASV